MRPIKRGRPVVDHDIFISYAHQDRSRVEPLVKAIEALGYSVWWDVLLRPGDPVGERIEQAISVAKCVLVVWSEAAERSQGVQAETKARSTDKLVPVLLEPFSGNFLGVDLTEWDGRPEHAAFQRLIRVIAKLAGPPPAGVTPTLNDAPPRATRRLRVPDIAWVEIPGGPFVYQQSETRKLPTFWIARYPVTNAQFQTFIDDDGYEEPRWWTDLKRPAPETPRWQQSNRPRTNVDWYECVAFTRWLNARLGLDDGSIRLPTELEWEKAARGERGLAFPWGNEYRPAFANIWETDNNETGPWYLAQPTAVGVYPHGASEYGVEDLCGTVWEWCSNQYAIGDGYPTSENHVQRGGSWLNYLAATGGIIRQQIGASIRNNIGGLRLVSTIPIAMRLTEPASG